MRGTTSILNSALKHGTGVRRVILTSSVAAVREEAPTPRDYDETSWNNAAIAAVTSKGSAAGPFTIYLASKTLAERAACRGAQGRARMGPRRHQPAMDLRGTSPVSPFRPMVLNIYRLAPRTAVSQPREDDRRDQYVPAGDLRHALGCADGRAVTGPGELGARVCRRRCACARDTRRGRWG